MRIRRHVSRCDEREREKNISMKIYSMIAPSRRRFVHFSPRHIDIAQMDRPKLRWRKRKQVNDER